jgi:hypothetical protein
VLELIGRDIPMSIVLLRDMQHNFQSDNDQGYGKEDNTTQNEIRKLATMPVGDFVGHLGYHEISPGVL